MNQNILSDMEEVIMSLDTKRAQRFNELPDSIQKQILSKIAISLREFHANPERAHTPSYEDREIYETSATKPTEQTTQNLPVDTNQVNSWADVEELAITDYDFGGITLPSNSFGSKHQVLDKNLIKLEYSSARESLFSGLGCLGVSAFIFLLIAEAGAWGLIPLALGIFFFKLSSQTDDYYLVDLNKRIVFLYKKFKENVEVTPFLSFHDIAYLAVNAKEEKSDKKTVWKYSLCAIKKNGEIQDLTDQVDTGFFDCFTFTAAIAKHMDVPLLKGAKAECPLLVSGSGQNLVALYMDG